MKTEADLVARQYTEWCYPAPVPDLGQYASSGVFDFSDPSLFRRRLWPRRTEPEALDILVAGCGTYQAAFYAFTNPRCRVLGVDVSETSLEHELYLKQRHDLGNLRLRQMDLAKVGALGEKFDLVVATGVLHHLAEPAAGLFALESVLRTHGVLSIMMYGRYNRAGVYTLQDLFRRVGLQQDVPSLEVIRATLAALPPWHHARSYLGTAPDLRHDAGLVDTFLHCRDRAYSVPEILDFVRHAGLAFQGWLDPGLYSIAEALPPAHPLLARTRALPIEEQWAVVELLTQGISCHRFLACHRDRPTTDYRPDAKSATGYKPKLAHRARIDDANVLQRWSRKVPLRPAEAKWLRRADGQTTIGELAGDAEEAAARFFVDMWDRGHVDLEL